MKVELMRVDCKLTLNAPSVVALGDQISFFGEFRIGISSVSGHTVYIYEFEPPEKLIGYATVDLRGRYSDFYTPSKAGRYMFFSRSYSPTNQSDQSRLASLSHKANLYSPA